MLDLHDVAPFVARTWLVAVTVATLYIIAKHLNDEDDDFF